MYICMQTRELLVEDDFFVVRPRVYAPARSYERTSPYVQIQLHAHVYTHTSVNTPPYAGYL